MASGGVSIALLKRVCLSGGVNTATAATKYRFCVFFLMIQLYSKFVNNLQDLLFLRPLVTPLCIKLRLANITGKMDWITGVRRTGPLVNILRSTA